MPFTQCTVTQPYGAGTTGTVTFTLDRQMTNGGEVAGTSASTTVALDGSGNISQAVPSNMDANTRPQGTRYRVTERITGRATRSYYVAIPAQSTVVLDTLARSDDDGVASTVGAVVLPVVTDRYIMATAQGQQRRVVTCDREIATSSMALTSGRAQYTAFTWQGADLTISSISSFIRGTAAATITLARLGLYTVSQDGSMQLVARTAASTTLGNSTFSNANAPLDATGGYPATYTLRQGQRYALGCIWVATTMPVVYGAAGAAITNGWLPWIAMSQSSQSDLPASVAFASLVPASEVCLMGAY